MCGVGKFGGGGLTRTGGITGLISPPDIGKYCVICGDTIMAQDQRNSDNIGFSVAPISQSDKNGALMTQRKH
jgi:hypothetical protein